MQLATGRSRQQAEAEDQTSVVKWERSSASRISFTGNIMRHKGPGKMLISARGNLTNYSA